MFWTREGNAVSGIQARVCSSERLSSTTVSESPGVRQLLPPLYPQVEAPVPQ